MTKVRTYICQQLDTFKSLPELSSMPRLRLLPLGIQRSHVSQRSMVKVCKPMCNYQHFAKTLEEGKENSLSTQYKNQLLYLGNQLSISSGAPLVSVDYLS